MSRLVLALPFLAAVIGLLLPARARRPAAALAVTATAGSLVLSIGPALDRARGHTAVETAVILARFGPLRVHAGLLADGLATVVAVAVCVVALLVQLYSVAYLHDDDAYPRYAAEVSLFTAAMLDVVLAGDLIMLVVGWEVMGICSYLLIGHYRDLPEARPAAVKAFLVTRVGDIGFLLGVLFLGVGAGTFSIAALNTNSSALPATTLVTACLLLLLGVAGKSAQFPLHTWLPDAMAGPTPISALIHAATMVAAGVYVVARLYPLFLASSIPLSVLGVVAAISMLLGAFAALAQDDLKRVLAWSTVSQIAYMSGALAVGAPVAAVFHLLTHAAFKALLFLAAGCVLHATGEALMSRMGGLRKQLPVTFLTMTCGLAALVGLPPFAGFFSKESVLGAAYAAARGETARPAWVGWLVLVAGLVTVALTAAYTTRLWLRTFFGVPRGARAAHEPSWLMRAPLLLLAVPTVLLGFIGLRPQWLASWISPGDVGFFSFQPLTGLPATHVVERSTRLDALTVAVSLALSAAAVAAVVVAWRRAPERDPVRPRPVLARAFYVDDLQDALVVRPYRRLAGRVQAIDTQLVDGAVEGYGTGTGRLSGRLSRLQNGNVQAYATGVLATAALLALVAVFL